MSDKDDKATGLALLRKPFPANQVSKLPKPTKAQTEEVRANFKAGIRCEVCGTWHHPKVVHLDYVGHAALTDRLLECDPAWNWSPVAVNPDGTPAIDARGGMWINLTVCGVTRLGYGHAVPKPNSGQEGAANAVKELIGDALRNAAMRFGAALDLWHKGQLHLDDDDAPMVDPPKAADHVDHPRGPSPADIAMRSLKNAETVEQLDAIWRGLPKSVQGLSEVIGAGKNRKAELTRVDDLAGDQIPYEGPN